MKKWLARCVSCGEWHIKLHRLGYCWRCWFGTEGDTKKDVPVNLTEQQWIKVLDILCRIDDEFVAEIYQEVGRQVIGI